MLTGTRRERRRFIGGLARNGTLLGAEGLRPTSFGARLTFKDGQRRIQPGPFTGTRELQGFVVVRVPTLDDAIEWATKFADAVGDLALDVRPVTEPWDVGFAPPPERIETTRFMVLHKADDKTERGFSRGSRERVRRLLEASTKDGTLPLIETNFLPSAKGKRVVSRAGALQVLDGPFAESKELVAGYVIVEAASLEEATEVARRYAHRGRGARGGAAGARVHALEVGCRATRGAVW